MDVTERSVQEIGKSLLITLPKPWANAMRVTRGTKLKIITDERGNLLIAPEFIAKEELHEASIHYDEHIRRHFFREYFGGNTRITIRFGKRPPERDLQSLYTFLRRFMNAQVIEEARDRIVVKCFRIDDLTIEECLQRVHFLFLSMLDETIAGADILRLQEMEESLSRFYYMLVMQIRRFLSEGKFTQQNQISLIRALDIRMVAERIERMADIMLKIARPLDLETMHLLGRVREYYGRSFGSFFEQRYDRASTLMAEERAERAAGETLRTKAMARKDIPLYDRTNAVLQLFAYAKEISMLVR